MPTEEQLIREDSKRLHGMGYAQEVVQPMAGFSNFAISFTIISILTRYLTSFAAGIGSAGPPGNAIVLGAALSFLLAVPSDWNTTTYVAVLCIATIALFISSVIPVYLRWRIGEPFVRGPWHLGRWSRPNNVVALCWVAFISNLFMQPTFTPITHDTFNDTPIVAFGTVAALTVWYLVSVRQWFTGPKTEGSGAQLAAIEAGLGEDFDLAPAWTV